MRKPQRFVFVVVLMFWKRLPPVHQWRPAEMRTFLGPGEIEYKFHHGHETRLSGTIEDCIANLAELHRPKLARPCARQGTRPIFAVQSWPCVGHARTRIIVVSFRSRLLVDLPYGVGAPVWRRLWLCFSSIRGPTLLYVELSRIQGRPNLNGLFARARPT